MAGTDVVGSSEDEWVGYRLMVEGTKLRKSLKVSALIGR